MAINKRQLELMEAKHEKEMEKHEQEMAALHSLTTMCNTVTKFFSKLSNDYDKIFQKKIVL